MTQTTFPLLCPVLGGFFCRAVDWIASQFHDEPWAALLPRVVVNHMPPTLPATIMSSIFMILMPVVFDLVDHASEELAHKKATEVHKGE
mmetsp:Transcript_11095/g.33734  ORF Transcript_11095/g.33734 Transcript_11095/m.33734 type:complete len:89 (-) Transcript_11095:142-408(-)